MTDIEELTQHLEQHPDDRDKRWLLAKQLYKSAHYEDARDHLLLLKKQWPLKLNITRYLAASYYRLNQYDEAVKTLRDVLDDWPKEVPMREQLARVLTVSGQWEEAAKVWQEILRLQPDHSMAQEVLAKTQSPEEAEKKEPEPLRDKDFGIGAGTGILCPACGSVNTEEFERCWKCHAALFPSSPSSNESTAVPSKHAAPSFDLSSLWNMVGGLACGGFLLLGLYLTFDAWPQTASAGQPDEVLRSVSELLRTELFPSRVAMGLVLLIGWPLLLWAASALTHSYDVNWVTILITGLFSASAAYASLWCPLQYVAPALLAVIGIGLPIIVLTFDADISQAVLAWLFQGAAATVLMACTFAAIEGPSLLLGIPVVTQYAQKHDAGPDPGRTSLPESQTPVTIPLRWETSGSKWLDSKAGEVIVELESSGSPQELIAEFKDETGTLYYDHVDALPFRFKQTIVPGRQYQLLVSGDQATPVAVTLYGLLTPAT